MKQFLCYLAVVLIALSTSAFAATTSRYAILPYSPNSSRGAQCTIPPAREQVELAKSLINDARSIKPMSSPGLRGSILALVIAAREMTGPVEMPCSSLPLSKRIVAKVILLATNALRLF
jgi:hypothetical protein